MNRTDINLTPEVVETIYDMQKEEQALTYVEVLQTILAGIIRDDMGSDEERLKLAGMVLTLQDYLRTFILTEEGGAQ